MSGDTEKKIDFNDPNQRFHITAEIAATLQGRIYAADDLLTGNFVVIKETWKQLVASGCSRDGTPVPENFFEETRLLNKLSQDPNVHPHFVHIICQWEEPLTYNYAMDGCKDGDLFDFVKEKHLKELKAYRASEFKKHERHFKKNCLPNNTKDKWILQVKHMFRQLVDFVYWINERGVAHLDMSLENTMVFHAATCNIKIIDFGLSRDCGKEKNWKFKKRVGKRGYMAPEVYGKQTYDCRLADVWSIGVMLYMMLIGAPPYELPQMTCIPFKYLVSGRLREMLTHWKRLHYVTDEIVELLISIFRPEKKRITIEKIRAHPFVNLINDPLKYGNNAKPKAKGGQQNNNNDDKKTENLSPQAGSNTPQINGIPVPSDTDMPQSSFASSQSSNASERNISNNGNGNNNDNNNNNTSQSLQASTTTKAVANSADAGNAGAITTK